MSAGAAAGARDGDVAARLAAVRARIDAAARRAGRAPGEVTLGGVAKRMPAPRVAAAVRAGLADVAENYVQEAREKIPAVTEALGPGATLPRWHFIGRLQRNKAHLAAALFDVVHSVDRVELARELDRRAGLAGRRLAVFLQASLCGEPQKGGAPPEALPALVEAFTALPHLDLVGLMTVPRDDEDPEAARPAFGALRALLAELRTEPGGAGLRALSMGMSADFEVAIAEGATHVRVGTAIFGPREG
jgi:hypothetical protein